MVLDPLSIDRSRLLANAQSSQERFDDLVSFPRLGRQSLAFCGQFDRLVRFGLNQAIALQSANRIVDRRMSHGKLLDQIDRPADTTLSDRVGNRFDIIFGNLARMIGTCSLMGS